MTDSNSLDKTLTEDNGVSSKKDKKKQKKDDAWQQEGPRDPVAMLSTLPERKQQEIQRALHLFSLGQGLPKTLQQAKKRRYRFWDTQPVPRLGDSVTTHGPIAEGEPNVREQPYSLPAGFSWDSLDLSRPAVLGELCTLLNENYIQEDDNTIRYDFSPEYLQWTLLLPDGQADLCCGVRVDANKKLVGFITAAPASVRVYDLEKQMVQVRFLCVHKKLRLKRMSPVLIREITRRVNQRGLHQAVYTADIVLPSPVSSCRYWHRPLKARKLMDVNFPGLRQTMTLQRAVKFNRLPEHTKTPGLRVMARRDVAQIHMLLQAKLSKFHLSPNLSLQETEHWLLPRESVIHTYVVEGDDGTLTDVVSFYDVSFGVLNHLVHKSLRAAHLFYLACAATDPADLMEDTLILAKSKGFDVFTALDMMDNKNFLEQLKFSMSDRSLYYYLYNWSCPNMSPDKVGLVLPN